MGVSNPPTRTIRICLMVNGHFSDDKNDVYDVFKDWLDASLESARNVKLEIDPYESRDQEYPSLEKMVHYDALLLSGAIEDALSNEDWIIRLIAFIRRIISHHPEIKIYAICFGSHIVARALGGSIERNLTPPEVGITKVQLSYAGKLLFDTGSLDLIQFHQDRIILKSLVDQLLHGDLYRLGSSTFTEVEGFVKLYPVSYNQNSNSGDKIINRIHILMTQGHPEFTYAVVANVLNRRHTKGGVSAEWFEEHDGIRVGRTFFRMLGVDYGDEQSPASPVPALALVTKAAATRRFGSWW